MHKYPNPKKQPMKRILLKQCWQNLFSTKKASKVITLTLGLTCFMLVLVWRSNTCTCFEGATAGRKELPGIQTRSFTPQFPVGFSIMYRSNSIRQTALPETIIASGNGSKCKESLMTRFSKRLVKVNGTMLVHLLGSFAETSAEDECLP